MSEPMTVKVAVLLKVDDEEPHEVGSVKLTGPRADHVGHRRAAEDGRRRGGGPGMNEEPTLESNEVYRDLGLSSKVEWLADGRVLIDGTEVPEWEGRLP